jgi:rubrerythrin
MEKEKSAENYYRELAGKCSNSGLNYILTLLADEELKHYELIEKMKMEAPELPSESKLMKEAKSAFEKMREAKEKFSFDISQVDLYKKAQEMEKQSQELYLEKAREFESEIYKGIFTQLAVEEEKHYNLLENIIQFISKPDSWLENAEFHHLDHY